MPGRAKKIDWDDPVQVRAYQRAWTQTKREKQKQLKLQQQQQRHATMSATPNARAGAPTPASTGANHHNHHANEEPPPPVETPFGGYPGQQQAWLGTPRQSTAGRLGQSTSLLALTPAQQKEAKESLLRRQASRKDMVAGLREGNAALEKNSARIAKNTSDIVEAQKMTEAEEFDYLSSMGITVAPPSSPQMQQRLLTYDESSTTKTPAAKNNGNTRFSSRKTSTHSTRKASAKRSASTALARGGGSTTKKTRKESVKEAPPPAPGITDDYTPPFFMTVLKDYQGWDHPLLVTQNGPEMWQFAMRTHLARIHELHPNLHLYVVAYRQEERPTLRDLTQNPNDDDHVRIGLPSLVVHALPKHAARPTTLMAVDGEAHGEESKHISLLSLKWEEVHTFEDGSIVHVLVDTTRTTTQRSLRRAIDEQEIFTKGGAMWFPVKFTKKDNPADVGFVYEDDELFFDDSVWGETRVFVQKALRDSTQEQSHPTNWKELYGLPAKEWIDFLVPKGVKAFCEYYDLDESLDFVVNNVQPTLLKEFKKFKREYDRSQTYFRQNEDAIEATKHFKIYPENEFIKPYLRRGSLNAISKWAKASDVFPHVAAEVDMDGSGNLVETHRNPPGGETQQSQPVEALETTDRVDETHQETNATGE